MKRLLLSFVALATFSFSFAQVTIEGTYLPVLGTSIQQMYDTTADNLTIPATGANMTWDYSNGFPNQVGPYTLQTFRPDTTPYGLTYFPSATHASYLRTPFVSFSDSLYSYFVIDYDGLHGLGVYSEKVDINTAFVSTPPELVMPFNITYGETVYDTSISIAYATYDVPPATGVPVMLKNYKTKIMQAQGYGTLITPLGSFNDVLMGVEVITSTDSLFADPFSTGTYSYNSNYVVPPYFSSNPQISSTIKYHWLRNNTFASTHLMLLEVPANNVTDGAIMYGWYTLPVDIGAIEGTVYDANQNGVVDGECFLYREHGNFVRDDILATTHINSDGTYRFDSIPYGVYRISARAKHNLYPTSLTTFYGDTVDWINCDTVVTSADISGIDINLSYIPNANVNAGQGSISGSLNSDNGFGGGKAGDPVPGVDISLEQVPGGIFVGQDRTSEGLSSTFVIDNIKDGTYTLWVDVPGMHMAGSYDITVIDGNVTSSLDFTMGMDSIYPISTPVITAGIKEYTKGTALFAYPNPFTSNILFELSTKTDGDIEISIYDLVGREVRTIGSQNTFTGIQILDWDGKNTQGDIVKAGLYIVSAKLDGKLLAKKKIMKH